MKNNGKKVPRFAALAALVLLGVAVAAPARADDDHRHSYGHEHAYGHETARHEHEWHDRAWEEHEREAREWRMRHHVYSNSYVYAPPTVIYAPPSPPPGISLIIPLDIR
ncbi:MAG: hypothetical protein KGI97_03925 [Alphaproteobacteria bacterium]|nr:hypothetical protein [Alphaproteobacteria bacterium]